MENDYIEFIYEFEQECERMSKDIISRLCKRVIKNMNKLDSYLAASSHDYPTSFSFFDILSIELQSKSYEEINPSLRDCVEGFLDNEYEKLPVIERFILDHSECAVHLECDIEAVQNKIYTAFNEMLNAHWETKKIQNFELLWH